MRNAKYLQLLKSVVIIISLTVMKQVIGIIIGRIGYHTKSDQLMNSLRFQFVINFIQTAIILLLAGADMSE